MKKVKYINYLKLILYEIMISVIKTAKTIGKYKKRAKIMPYILKNMQLCIGNKRRFFRCWCTSLILLYKPKGVPQYLKSELKCKVWILCRRSVGKSILHKIFFIFYSKNLFGRNQKGKAKQVRSATKDAPASMVHYISELSFSKQAGGKVEPGNQGEKG